MSTDISREMVMTNPHDFDPNLNPRSDFGRRTDPQMEMDRRMGSPTPWGWIAGAVFIIVILALVFTSNDGTRTASNEGKPPETTGMAPKTAPPAITVPPRTDSPSTTGQSKQ
jgi:hypothetical protein